MELSQDGVRQLEAILESGSDLSEEDGDEKAVLQERDEAKEKLEEFEQASRALLVELNSLEAEYEIEKSCRVQAEAYAMQMNRENTKLKRISAALLPMLSHPTVDFVSLDNEDENAGELTPDPMGQYLQQIKDLQTKVSHLLYEKKDLNLQVKELQDRVQCLQEQVEEEASEKKSLQAFVKHHQQALRRVKQVSRLVTEEYDEISRQLDLEQELRQQAEEFAHQMLVKTEEAKRQSMILIQSTKADSPLLQALDEVAKMTRALEETKRDHQAKVEELETQLAKQQRPEELCKLQAALSEATEKQACLEKQLLQAEERNSALEERVKLLEESAQLVETSLPGPCSTAPPLPPPPPPPPLPPPSPIPADPLLAIRQRKGMHPTKQETVSRSTDDCKVKAVEEMMARIKNGVVLRSTRVNAEASPKGQTAEAVNKRRSTVMELQTLLSTVKTPARKSSRRKSCQKHKRDNQLEAILQRRRRIVDCPGQAQQQHTAAQVLGHRTPVHTDGATTGEAHSSPKAELLEIPHPNRLYCAATSEIQAGDHGKAAAKPPWLSKEKSPTPGQRLQRAACLQTSRRIAPLPGSLP